MASDVRFARSSPVCTYWLAHCAGFRVESRGGRVLGTVEDVALRGPASEAEALVVRRSGLRPGRYVLGAGAVAAVAPWRGAVVVASRHVAPRRETMRSLAERAAAAGRAAFRLARSGRTGS